MVEKDKLDPVVFSMSELSAKGINIRADCAWIHINLKNSAEVIEEAIVCLGKILDLHRAAQDNRGDFTHDDLGAHLPGIDPYRDVLHCCVDHQLNSEGRLPDPCISSHNCYLALTEALKVFVEAFPSCGKTTVDFIAEVSRQMTQRDKAL